MLKHCFLFCFFLSKMNTTQFRPDFFFNFLWSKGQNLFPTLGGQINYFIYKNCQTPPLRNQLVVPKINQEINEPSYEMVGVILWTKWLYFCQFFIFFSDNSKCFHRNGFEMYILIIIYTACTCNTLVPTRILIPEISWFCFDFPKWGPVSFIITDFNVFVQFFE